MRLFWLATGAALAAFPAAAQQIPPDADELYRHSSPQSLQHCRARARGNEIFDCLRFRARYPVREWRGNMDASLAAPPPAPPAPVTNGGRGLGDAPERYFPRLSEPIRFDGPVTRVSRCRADNSGLLVQRDKALREGRTLMEYHISVLAMTPEQIAAEQARQRYARPMSNDPELARRMGPFLGYARSVAAGERQYSRWDHALLIAIESAVRRYGVANTAYRRAVEECVAIPEAMPVEEPRPVTPIIPGPTWAGTWESNTSRFQISGGAGGLSVSYNGLRGLNQSGSATCTVSGGTATCRGSGNYQDSDKSIAYSETWTITIAGDTIRGTWKIPLATPNWNIPEGSRYTPVLHTGNGGSFSMNRVK